MGDDNAPHKLDRLLSRLTGLAEDNGVLEKERDRYKDEVGKLNARVESLEGQLVYESARRRSISSTMSPPASPPSPPSEKKHTNWEGVSVPSPPSMNSSPIPKPSAPRRDDYLYTPNMDSNVEYVRMGSKTPSQGYAASPAVSPLLDRCGAEIAYLKEQLNRTTREILETKEAAAAGEKVIALKDIEIRSLKEAQTSNKERLKAVMVELDARRNQKSMMTRKEKERVLALQVKLSELKEENEANKSDQTYNGYIRKELGRVQGELQSVTKACDKKDAELADLQAENTSLKKASLQKEATLEATITSLKSQLKSHENCLQTSHSHLLKALTTPCPAADILYSHPELITHLTAELDSHREQQARHQQTLEENNALRSQSSSWQHEVKVAKEKQIKAEEGLRIIEKHNRAKANEEIGALKDELSRYREALDVSEAKIEELNEAVEYQVSVETESAKGDEMDTLREELGRKTEVVKEIRRAAEGRLKRLECEVETMRQKCHSLETEKDLAEASSERYKASCEQLHAELRIAAQIKSSLAHQLRVTRDTRDIELSYPQDYDDNMTQQSFEVSLLQSLARD